MTNKIKLIFPVLALGILLSGTAFADTTNSVNANVAVTKSVCIANAKTTYTNAVKSATDTARAANLTAKNNRTTSLKEAGVTSVAGSTAVKTAKTAYQAALKSAKALTDKTARTTAIKTATDNYKTALKNAGVTVTTGSTAVKAANSAYKIAITTNAKTKAASIKVALSSYTATLKTCPAK